MPRGNGLVSIFNNPLEVRVPKELCLQGPSGRRCAIPLRQPISFPKALPASLIACWLASPLRPKGLENLTQAEPWIYS